MKKLKCILLIDDNPSDNSFHQMIIEEMNITENIEITTNGIDALDFLNNENSVLPDLILLDINMPKMNGWEFLEEYKKIDPIKKAKMVVVILSTSINPGDIKRAKEIDDVSDFETKPLDMDAIENILYKFFKNLNCYLFSKFNSIFNLISQCLISTLFGKSSL